MEGNKFQFKKILSNYSRYIEKIISEFNYERYGLSREDLRQEVYLKIWKVLENVYSIKYLPTYIKMIVKSVVIDQISLYKKEINFIDSKMQMAQKLEIFPGNKNEEYVHIILVKSIDSLKESKKIVLNQFLDGNNILEISKLNRWSTGKTNDLFYRAIKDLKKKL